MELLIMGVLMLFYFVVAVTSTTVAVVFTIGIVALGIKIVKIILALMNAALKEPEDKTVKKIRVLARKSEKKKDEKSVRKTK